MDAIAPEDLHTKTLIRRLCSCIAAQALPGPRDSSVLAAVQAQLQDTAYSVLFGLHPEAEVAYVDPTGRQALVDSGLQAAGAELQASGYGDLSLSLAALTQQLRRHTSVVLPNTLTEAEVGRPLAIRFTEHAQLLSLLLGLRGSQPCVRRRQTTFQAAADRLGTLTRTGKDGAEGEEALQQSLALSSAVFTAVPDPDALTEVSASTAVLLPQELGYPQDAYAGAAELQDLAACMASRPTWDPTAAEYAPAPASAAWLPVPAALVEMQADSRRQAAPSPLGLPLGLLALDDDPGAFTAFDKAGADEDDASSLGDSQLEEQAELASAHFAQLQLRLQLRPLSPVRQPGWAASAWAGGGSRSPGKRQQYLQQQAAPPWQPAGGWGLWSAEEAGLARDGLLALQGVHSALVRLQAALAAPATLPRRSAAGLVAQLAAAGEVRARLQLFVEALSAPGWLPAALPPLASSSPGTSVDQLEAAAALPDPVQHAFAAAVAEVLRQQAAALQLLEQQHGMAWVEEVGPSSSAAAAAAAGSAEGKHSSGSRPGSRAATGKGSRPGSAGSTRSTGNAVQGRRAHRPALTLLQVALHTGQLQRQLVSLAALCWCDSTPSSSNGTGHCRWEIEHFPAGTQLLSYLYTSVQQAQEADAAMVRHLFAAALQPYLRHMHAWAFTTQEVAPEFATAGDKEACTLDFLPPQPPGACPLVPVDPPSFLQPIHAAFMRAGSQLRLLDSLPQHGKQLALQLAGLAEQEQAARAAAVRTPATAAAGGALAPAGRTSMPAVAAAAAAVLPLDVISASEAPASASAPASSLEESGSWLDPAPTPGSGSGEVPLQLSSRELQAAVRVSQAADAARVQALDRWLDGLALQRRLAEHAVLSQQLERTATLRAQQAQRAQRAAAALLRQQSAKAVLLQEQQAAVVQQRARAAAHKAQQQAEEQRLLAQAALQEHAAAVAELSGALAAVSVGTPLDDAVAVAPEQTESEAGPAAEGQQSPVRLPALELPAAPTSPFASAAALAAPDSTSPPAAAAEPRLPAGLPTAHSGDPGRPAVKPVQSGTAAAAFPPAAATGAAATATGRGSTLLQWDPLPAAAGADLPELALLRQAEGVDAREEEGNQRGQTAAPLSAVLETSISQAVLSQYRTVSRACVRLFLEELRVLEHLQALRRLFFCGAGDWADAWVQGLNQQADSLEPLTGAGLDRLLQSAIRVSSLERDQHAALLHAQLLPSVSVIDAQVQAVASATPQKYMRAFGREPTTGVVLPPTQLDALDCVVLHYRVGWPLSAVITPDTLQGYAAVHSMMLRLRRLHQLLRALHAPLMHQPRSTAGRLLEEEEAGRALRRVQCLRAFHQGCLQLVAAVQVFLQARVAGEGWLRLLAKLMVSSEEVAAAVVTAQPSGGLGGALSRMNSVGPTGKAAQALAHHLARTLSGSGGGRSAAGSGRSTPTAAGSRPLSRFNSLVSALQQPPAGSGGSTPRAGSGPAAAGGATARQLSRFASSQTGSRQAEQGSAPAAVAPAAAAPAAAPAAATAAPALPLRLSSLRPLAFAAGKAAGAAAAASADSGCSPTAASVGSLTRQSSLATVASGGVSGAAFAAVPWAGAAAFAAEAGRQQGEAGPAAATAGLGPGVDAAAWVRQLSQSQAGIADLQELLELHRAYVRGASEDCLTFGGHPEVRQAVEGALQATLDYAIRLQGAMRAAAAGQAQDAWAAALAAEEPWGALAGAMQGQQQRVCLLQGLLGGTGSTSVLRELALLLDFNGFYGRRSNADGRS